MAPDALAASRAPTSASIQESIRLPDPHSQDKIDREIRYAMAVGVVESVTSKGTKGRNGLRYRRFIVFTSDGERHAWSPAQVLAFAAGVRLATTRKGS
jgi:hypothetical protein